MSTDTYAIPEDAVLPARASSYFVTPSATYVPPGQEHRLILSVPRDQAYYWTHAWQSAEAESLAEFARGESVAFDTAADAIRWLLSED